MLEHISFRLQLLFHAQLDEICHQKWCPAGQQVPGGCCWWQRCKQQAVAGGRGALCCNHLLTRGEHKAVVGRIGMMNVFSAWQPLIRQEERISCSISVASFWKMLAVASGCTKPAGGGSCTVTLQSCSL